jgi:hypothetical protein
MWRSQDNLIALAERPSKPGLVKKIALNPNRIGVQIGHVSRPVPLQK